MNAISGHTSEQQSFDFIGLLAALWNRKWLIALATVAGFLLAVLYLNITTPTYSTEMRVTAAASSPNALSSRLGNLGGLAAVAGLPIGGSNKADPFELYLEALTSRDVADVLAKDHRILVSVFPREWDPAAKVWRRPPTGLAQQVKAVLGLPTAEWQAPDGARLQDYLQREIVVTRNAKSPITLIGYETEDPSFGLYLLDRMNQSADRSVRSRALMQAQDYKAYLTEVLPTVGLADVRQSLAAALAEQYESVMMAQSSVPYAALPISAPQASLAPTRPRVTVTLALGLLFGLVLGTVLALVDFRETFRRISRRKFVA